MRESQHVREFLERYRDAFTAFDASAIADLFAYPCHITSGGDGVALSVVSTRDGWAPQLERLLDAYRAIGVRSAQILKLEAIELPQHLAIAVVEWRMLDARERPLYDFAASYTLADLGDGLRIAALAHNETLRVLARLRK